METREKGIVEEYKEVNYIVTRNPIGAFVAYIRVPDDHSWQQYKGKMKPLLHSERLYDVSYDDVPLEVHGGLTFSVELTKPDDKWPQGFTPGFWIGWDYAHSGDVTSLWSDGYEWTREEVVDHAKRAIDSMLETIYSKEN